MVTELVISVLLGLVSFLIGLLPNDTLDWPEAESMGAWAGAIVGPLDSWMPISELVACCALTITVVLPALFVYRLAMWLWTLLPSSISGSGPS